MSRGIAIIKVICCRENVDETAALVASAVGHQVFVQLPDGVRFGWLFFPTGLPFENDSERFSRHFGFAIIGKIPGVLSWEVVPSEGNEPDRAKSHEVDPVGAAQSRVVCFCQGRSGCQH
jgi:hypothetical protein